MLIHFGKVFLYLFPVYLVGYLGLSISWVLFALMLWMWWKRNRTSKLARFAAAVDFLDNERHVITEGLKELNMPAWVHFPDVEKADWLNQILDQAWPYFGIFMEKVFRNSIEPAVRASNIHLKTFTFTKIHFGEKPLKIKGVKACTKGLDKRQVILDLQISYVADCEINVEIKKICKAGVKGMQLHGTLRVILEPLIGQSPLVGGVTFFFIRRPLLEINWTGLTNLLDVPGLNDMSDGAILDIISSYMVLPNRYCVPLIDQVQLAQMRFPLPSGVVRVHLIEAEDLVPKDTYMMGMVKGKSDPYANLRVGTQSNRSKTIKENLNPKWNEVYEFVVHEAPGQDLELEMFDEDPDKDDFLGSLVIELGEVMKDRVVDEWFPLSDIERGKVHLKLEWLSLLMDLDRLVENNHNLSCAILVVYLDSAYNLPRNHFEYSNNEYGMKKNKNPKYLKSKKSNGEPSAHVEFSIDKELQKSKVSRSTKDPVWEESFTFFIKNVHSQCLTIKIKDDDKKCALGVLSIPLKRLLTAAEMTMDQRFQLEHAGPSSMIKMKAMLRVLAMKEPDPDSVYTGLNALKKGPLNLIAASQGGSDPYVRIYLFPERSWSSRKKTTVKKRSVNPLFDEKFEYSVPLEEAQRRKLDIAVKHNKSFTSHERKELGKISVDNVIFRFEYSVPLEEAQRRKLDIAVKHNKSFTSHERKELGKVLVDLSQHDLIQGFTQWSRYGHLEKMTDLVAVWEVALSDGVHKIEFEHGTTSGKRVAYVDGKEALRRDWMFKLVGKETFSVGGTETKATINIDAVSGFAYEYTLEINGKSLKKYMENRSKTSSTWVINLDGVDCRIVLEKDTMDIWCNGKKMETAGEFVDDGTETHFTIGDHDCYIKAVSSGKRREGIIHSLIVDETEIPEAAE
ncbi:Extended synaptotagmin-3 [Acipenser ruthenus]|uniref:Fas apoptotic inhibitory molecule 1 n=2 Tax=Acipenser ruthenus TaxID=7906 RepID=A0A444UFL5_ACIRT|nr:Extended synaptotagmin-3 [Acipenser ruthenus]